MLNHLSEQTISKGTVIQNHAAECTGLLVVKSGQLRAYILSDEGREITLYRLFDRGICLFSASCMLHSIQFEVTVEAEKDTELWIIPSNRIVFTSFLMMESVYRKNQIFSVIISHNAVRALA